jgi:small conductance mechanosensitive channel
MHRAAWILGIALLGLLGAPAAPAQDAEAPAAGKTAEAAPTEGEATEEDAGTEEEQPPGLAEKGEALLEDIRRLVARTRALEEQFPDARGEDLEALQLQVADAKISALDLVSRLIDNFVEQQQAGLDTAELRAFLEPQLVELRPAIIAHIDKVSKKLSDLRQERETLDPSNVVPFETRVARSVSWMSSLFGAYVEYIDNLEKMGLPMEEALTDLRERLTSKANLIEGRVALVTEQLGERRQRAAESPDDSTHRQAIQALDTRLQTETRALTDLVGLMDRVGLDSSKYRQILIQSTGEVTTDVFRRGVLLGLVRSWTDDAREWIRVRGPAIGFRLIVVSLVLTLFWIVARITRLLLYRRGKRAGTRKSRLVQNMMQSLTSRVIMIIGLLVALSMMGVAIGPLLAGLGIAGFIVGFALQDTLSNFAAGVMILTYRPFDLDDFIEAGGVQGKVGDMSLVSTTILTFDNQTLIVPNSKIWGDVIKNITHQSQRRVDMVFRISFADDVDRAEETLRGILVDHPKVLEDPASIVKLHELGEYAVEFIVRPWVNTADYWDVYWDVTREVKRRFDAEGIVIPTREVRLADPS